LTGNRRAARHPGPRPGRWLPLLGVAWLAACGGAVVVSDRPPHRPDRREYELFRERHPELLEPNYLPFMVHRVRSEDPPGDILFFCRWDDEEARSLPVHIEPPAIPEALQDELRPVEPEAYVRAVERALVAWDVELEDLVGFRPVRDADDARLDIRILGEAAPSPDGEVQVLGSTESLVTACRVDADVAPGADPLPVSFHVPELLLYVADQAGLLTPYQVERVALHEIGHALGMRGHSPIPSDFMYPVVRDRPAVKGLSFEDVSSFLSLYLLPNGTRYAFVPAEGRPPPPEPVPPSPLPEISTAPHVAARHGFELSPPVGWLRVPTRRGVFVSDGPIWDRFASVEVVVWGYPTLESFLRRFAPVLFGDRRILWQADAVVLGRPALLMAARDPDDEREEEFLFVEVGDGRVLMALSDYPARYAHRWRPWMREILSTLVLWEPSRRP